MTLVFFGVLLALLPPTLAMGVTYWAVKTDINEPITLEPHPVAGDATSSSET